MHRNVRKRSKLWGLRIGYSIRTHLSFLLKSASKNVAFTPLTNLVIKSMKPNFLAIISIKEGRLHVGPYVKQNVIMSTRKQKTKTQISKHLPPVGFFCDLIWVKK